jgi:uncharacterized SAM-dependent methyltransferase
MGRKTAEPSQLAELILTIGAALGASSDRELAALAGVSLETIANWRNGAVQELKVQKLEAIKRAFTARIEALEERAGHRGSSQQVLVPIEIEEGSSPSDLQKQLRELVHYDYLGHRFLYFEPQGALAWERLINTGYGQDVWLQGATDCAQRWLDSARDARGLCRGPIARALGFGKSGRLRGVDIVSLGPGEGGKEAALATELLDLERRTEQSLPWMSIALADVSIALLLKAAQGARRAMGDGRHASVLPFCADFEEGSLSFTTRLPSQRMPPDESRRLVVILGNVFGNLRDEETFVRKKLARIARPGDLVWIEVALRPDRIESDPIYRMTVTNREETAAEANRRLLLEGPYRRWEVALGRKPHEVSTRVWVREDDEASRIPGSCNFCHDLVLEEEKRTCTMLYSRRYRLEPLTAWFERQGYTVERVHEVADPKGQPRVAHILLAAQSHERESRPSTA